MGNLNNDEGEEIFCEKCKTGSNEKSLKMPFGWIKIESKERYGSGAPKKTYFICPGCTRSTDLVEFLKSLKPEIRMKITMAQQGYTITLKNVVI